MKTNCNSSIAASLTAPMVTVIFLFSHFAVHAVTLQNYILILIYTIR